MVGREKGAGKRKRGVGGGGGGGSGGVVDGKAVSEQERELNCLGIFPPDKKTSALRKVKLRTVPGYQDLIYVVEDFLSGEECAAWMGYGLRTGYVETFHKASAGMAHRDNGRIQFESEDIAARIYERIRPFLPDRFEGRQPSSCSSNIRLYRYMETQRFGRHIDEAQTGSHGEQSVFTLLMYLNDEGLRGGETVFYKGNYGDRLAFSFAPKAGAALIHGHGSRCLVHEGRRVEQGEKLVLRTDVMYK